jgi:hypothetical protein
MQIEDVVAYIALAWLIIAMLFIARSIRRGQALADTLAMRHREKYKAWGEPRPGFLHHERRDRFARFVAQRKYLELGDSRLAAQFEAYRKDERRLMLVVISTMVIMGGLVLLVQYGRDFLSPGNTVTATLEFTSRDGVTVIYQPRLFTSVRNQSALRNP